MFKVMTPRLMNETFARAFNTRNIDYLLALYEADATHVDGSGRAVTGTQAIGVELEALLQVPGTMISNNNFCLENGELALLRADWALIDERDASIASGSSAEIVRRQADGSWRYVIDHAAGASLARIA